MNESEETEEIKTYPTYPRASTLTCCNRPCPSVSQSQLDAENAIDILLFKFLSMQTL